MERPIISDPRAVGVHVTHTVLKTFPHEPGSVSCDGRSRCPVKLFRVMLNEIPLSPGKSQEDSKICCRQTIVASEGHSIVRYPYAVICSLASCPCPRKENQLKQKKKDEEAREQTVRRVYVTSTRPIHLAFLIERTSQTPNGFFDVLATQRSIGPSVSRADRYQLHQLQLPKQAGVGQWYDGLSICKMLVRFLRSTCP